MTLQRLVGVLVVTQTLLLGVIAWQLRDVATMRQTLRSMETEQLAQTMQGLTQIHHQFEQLRLLMAWKQQVQTIPCSSLTPCDPLDPRTPVPIMLPYSLAWKECWTQQTPRTRLRVSCEEEEIDGDLSRGCP